MGLALWLFGQLLPGEDKSSETSPRSRGWRKTAKDAAPTLSRRLLSVSAGNKNGPASSYLGDSFSTPSVHSDNLYNEPEQDTTNVDDGNNS